MCTFFFRSRCRWHCHIQRCVHAFPSFLIFSRCEHLLLLPFYLCPLSPLRSRYIGLHIHNSSTNVPLFQASEKKMNALTDNEIHYASNSRASECGFNITLNQHQLGINQFLSWFVSFPKVQLWLVILSTVPFTLHPYSICNDIVSNRAKDIRSIYAYVRSCNISLTHIHTYD